MLRNRFARRLAVLEARFAPPFKGSGLALSMDEFAASMASYQDDVELEASDGHVLAQTGRPAAGQDDGEGPEGADPGGDAQGGRKRASRIAQEERSPDDAAKDLAAEVEELERRRQELEAELKEASVC